MNGGATTVLLVSCVSLAGCTAATSGVKVRAIADPSAAISRGGDSVAVARGQLVLGNVGLALEAFRKAQRYYPSDPAPLAGIGDCYVAMGRLDLAQSNYEAALALAPHDRRLLLGLASIFDAEGQPMRAAMARAEASGGVQVAAPAPRQEVSASRPLAQAEQPTARVAAVGSITVDLPPVRTSESMHVQALAPAALTIDYPTEESSVTVPLPPARQPSKPLPSRERELNIAVAVSSAPRLERLSRGEVALVTMNLPVWRAPIITPIAPATNRRSFPPSSLRIASASSVRWVPLGAAPAKANVQILNAARSQGLAASARTVLSGRGWRKIAIGDAPRLLRKSVVLFPKSRAALGRRLAAQFRVAARMVERDNVVLILGTDSVRAITGQRKA